MGKIRQLPSELISKIAAGEVIERPCFAVKELIENAIDANSSYIKVDIEDYGLKKILMIDDGDGMDEEDLKKCFLPHTTSKVLDDDLIEIKTLGFRGEALSSIAAVCDLQIISKQESSPIGAKVEINNGEILNFLPFGSPQGTQVLVTNLFDKVPARKKFLKTKRTEYRHILDMVTQFAISYPKIQFVLIHNKKVIFDLPKNQSILDRVKLLLGDSIYENNFEIKYEESYLKIKGYLTKPQVSSFTSTKSFIFINGRRVFDNLITNAVKEAYGSLLESTSYPVFLLYIDIPKELIDVNIHPRKEQVNFHDGQFVYSTINKATLECLNQNNLTFANLGFKDNFANGSTNSYIANLLKEEVLEKDVQKDFDVLQVHNLYLITQNTRGITIFDQHAVHERILFEQFLKSFNDKKKNKIVLENSILFTLSPSDAQILLDKIDLFENLGFEIIDFGNNSFKVESIPEVFKGWNINLIIEETIDDIKELGVPKDIDSKSKKMLQYLACRSAIKGGEVLDKQQIDDLLIKLQGLNLAYTCPHGRPVKIEMSLNFLDRLFKRKS